MKKNKHEVILLGGGGHARVLIDLLQMSASYSAIGILDPALDRGTTRLGIPVLGDDGQLPLLYERGIRYACVAVGSTRDNQKRKELFDHLKQLGYRLPVLVHQKAIVSANVLVDEGVQIMAGAMVQSGAVIGENSIINTGAIVEHDCRIESHVHVCSGAVLSGGCRVGAGAFIGAGATIIQEVDIGADAVIAAGALVISSVAACQKVMGVPARPS
jgi:UDP-perosamine 4-acetyltransferase